MLADGVGYHRGQIVAEATLTTLLGVGAELAAPERTASAAINRLKLCLCLCLCLRLCRGRRAV